MAKDRDTLDRDRLPNNLIDRLEALERKVLRLQERQMPSGAAGNVLAQAETSIRYQIVLVNIAGHIQMALRRVS